MAKLHSPLLSGDDEASESVSNSDFDQKKVDGIVKRC